MKNVNNNITKEDERVLYTVWGGSLRGILFNKKILIDFSMKMHNIPSSVINNLFKMDFLEIKNKYVEVTPKFDRWYKREYGFNWYE